VVIVLYKNAYSKNGVSALKISKKLNMKKLIQIATVVVFSTVILIGCSGKINKDNYSKISNGMSISQVESVLGKGESQASSSVDLGAYGGNVSSEVITWQSGMKVISITFSNGKVAAKANSGL
tara:strand:+ start:113 stop:481 length:369 start_codon:yes stop_codon:yes gene_type:complete